MKKTGLTWKNFANTLVRKFHNVFFLTLIALLLVSCAQQVSPTGGPKDTEPPKILESSPLNGALNYTGSSIELQFDEYVKVNSANKELLVTPPFETPPEFGMRSKKVTLSWTDTLIPNTTYLFQFGKGIVDMNENNALDSNLFVFSTGDYLDSFELKGKVVDAFTSKPLKDVWVMLYPENEDSLPYKSLPRYFAKTDEQGGYHLRYLSKSDYKVFGLEPVNNGYLFDQPDEVIGFIDEMIPANNPRDTNAALLKDLRMFVQEDTLQFLKEYSQIENKGLAFLFNRPVDTLEIIELGGTDISLWTPEWNTFLDSVAYWFDKPLDYDSLKFHLNVDGFIDTVFFRKPSNRMGKLKKGSSKDMGLSLKAVSPSVVNHFGDFRLKSKTPIKSSDFSTSLFIEDGDTLSLSPYAKTYLMDVVISHQWKQGGKYKLLITDSSICDKYSLCNDTLLFSFVATKKEDFGELKVNYDLPEQSSQYVWQLLKPDGKLVFEELVSPKGEVEYKLLPTGKYQVKVIADQNQNGKWDSGNYLQHKQPERVYFYDQEIEVRSNWQSEIEWNLKLE